MESNDKFLEDLKRLFENMIQQLAVLQGDQFPVFTGAQIIQRLDISDDQLSKWHKLGLEHAKIGHVCLYTREDLLKFYNANKK